MTTAPPPRARRRAYYPLDRFPELREIQRAWETIREEATLALSVLGAQVGRGVDDSWILPLVPEAEDRHVIDAAVSARARELAPTTVRLMTAVPYVVAYAFSKLAPGKHIAPHAHWNPYLNAILCLRDGGARSHILVDDQRHDFRDGNLMVFDYTLTHESYNHGHDDRQVLLMIIDPRRCAS